MAKEKLSGIYAIVNKVNFKVYIGSAVDLNNRKSKHFSDLSKNKHRNSKLQNAWNKYGEENFVFDTLEIVEDKNTLINREQFWLDFSNSVKIGYNINPVAGSRLGAKQTPEVIEKVRQKLIGRKHSEETKQKISEGNKGKIISEEARQKMSDARKTSQKCIDHRIKISKSKIGTKHAEETLEKMRKIKLGKTQSEETKQKIREANTGRVHTEETRKKISEAKRARDLAKKLTKENPLDNKEIL